MSKVPTETQVSAGGVVFRRREEQMDVALISVGEDCRWQLPKGIVQPGESPEAAAVREVREETGLQTEMIGPLDTIEYWYQSTRQGRPVRFHKYVHFYLLRYQSGDVGDHDHEVNEARWVEIHRAQEILAFESEKDLVRRAQALIEACP
ncbi:MAG: NUDIX hydrolase [Candidatus Tectomicrobia bacterium]|uniref:NUDIX hydrolase n=1 Tax=Tectimicrobiota bacterium TaxID=2528274 RepID=A0A932FW12_UNCTE|nr:NUDIX hydrolase [Candidatus Tectomicrobia bacterium]